MCRYGSRLRHVLAVIVLAGLLAGCVPTDPPVVTGQKVADPVILPAGGSFAGMVEVTVVCTTPDATVRYTIDGTTPSPASGTIYQAPFTIAETTTIQAFAYMDGKDPSDVTSATFTKIQVEGKPLISGPSLDGDLVQGEPCTVTVACTITAAGTQVQTAAVDLSQIGGPAAQSLVCYGNLWGWFGTVTPPTAGPGIITLSAVDEAGGSAIVTLPLVVTAPRHDPALSNLTATGDLTQHLPGTVTLTCTATDQDGPIQSVTADLSTIGGHQAQALTYANDQWTWSGTLTPSVTGTRTITVTAVDDDGDTATASTAITVAPANQPPSITSPLVNGTLLRDHASVATVSCDATDPDGTATSVTADLSAIGGSASQPLTLVDGTWTWSGTLTPAASGTRTVTFTATDNDQATTTVSIGVLVDVANEPPAISAAGAAGTLTTGNASTITVTCTASDPEGHMSSVKANLSQVGGSNAQSLALSGNQYTWTGTITPASQGPKTITFTATDAAGATATATASITVIAPNAAPTITAATAAGTLYRNQPCTLTLHCAATDDDTVQSVTADLSAVAGSASQALALDNGDWTWTGTVTAASTGSKAITFTATDNAGRTSTATATINVTIQPGTLEGTWSGDVTYEESAWWGASLIASESSTHPCSVTFSWNYQPDALPVCVGNSNQEILIPATTLLAIGDQIVTDAVEPRSHKTFTITAVVTDITRDPAAFVIYLNLTLVGYSSPWTGTYCWSAELDAGDHLIWSETTDWSLGMGITEEVHSTGTLARQQ